MMRQLLLFLLLCFNCRRPGQAHFQTRSYSGRRAGRKSQSAQRPVSSGRMQGFTAGCYPHSTPEQRETPDVPAKAPSPFSAEAAAGIWHLCHPPGEYGADQGSASDSPLSDGLDHLSFLVKRNVKLLSKERSFTLFILKMSKGNSSLRVGSNGTQCWEILLPLENLWRKPVLLSALPCQPVTAL